MTKTVTVQRGEFTLVPLKEIDVQERIRMQFTELQELAASIDKLGLIHPLTVVPHPEPHDGFKYVLVAGERRLRALMLLNVLSIPVQVRSDITPIEQKIIEQDENLQRCNLSWQERIEGERQLDLLKRAQAEVAGVPWTIADTAKYLNTSTPTAAREVAFAQKLVDNPKLREQVKDLPITAAIRKVERIEAAKKASREGLVITGHLRCGDCRELLGGVGSGTVACVVTDPPFGVTELAGDQHVSASGGASYKAMLKPDDNATAVDVQRLMKRVIPELFRVLVPGGNLYLFFAQENYGFLRETVLDAGFEIQEYPLIWYKGKSMSPGRGYLYMPCTELVLFGWKPPRSRMLEKNMTALIEVPPVSVKTRLHPFQKPVKLLETFILQSTIQGETVLDPFAGVGSTVIAALRTKRTAVGFEKDPEHAVLGQKRIASELAKPGAGD